MNFSLPLTLSALFLGLGSALVRTPTGRACRGRSAIYWSVAFAIGALGSTLSFGAVQLLR